MTVFSNYSLENGKGTKEVKTPIYLDWCIWIETQNKNQKY